MPLYVGGDLEPVEAWAVRAWLTRHPERVADVEAALAARRVLLGSAEARSAESRSAEGVDLWPGIRTALQAEGWIGAPRATTREGASLSAGPPAAWAPVRDLAPVGLPASGQPRATRPRRYAATASAAAAALLFTGGLAWMLGFGGLAQRAAAPEVLQVGRGAIQVAGASRSVAGPSTPKVEALVGGAPDVRLVARPELPNGVIRLGELQRPPMEQHAVDVDLGNYYPGAVFPIGRPAPANTSLVGGVEGTGEVFLAPPRRR